MSNNPNCLPLQYCPFRSDNWVSISINNDSVLKKFFSSNFSFFVCEDTLIERPTFLEESGYTGNLVQ